MTSQRVHPSEDEQQLANLLLVTANCHRTGVLKSEAAIDLFQRSCLSVETLRDIWSIADKDNRGELSFNEVVVAIRLMGWVQAGETLSDKLLVDSGPLPTLEGISDVRKPSSHSQNSHLPPVNPEIIDKSKRIFRNSGPVNGCLDRNKARECFMTYNLSYEDLRKLEKLVNKDERDILGFQAFALGIYLTDALQSCLIASLPLKIPPEIYRQFQNLPTPDLTPSPISLLFKSTNHSRAGPSDSMHASTSRPRHSQIRPIRTINKPEPNLDNHNDHQWVILPHEKLEAEKHFSKLDIYHKGYVEAEPARKFLLLYADGLSAADFALIWNLADLNGDNRLIAEGLAIGLHIMRQKSAGMDIPKTLPPSLRPSQSSATTTTPIMSPLQRTISLKSKPPPVPPKKPSLSSKSPTIHSAAFPPLAEHSLPLSLPSAVPSLPRAHSSSISSLNMGKHHHDHHNDNSKHFSHPSPPLSPKPSISRIHSKSTSAASLSIPSISFLTDARLKHALVPESDESPFEDTESFSSSSSRPTSQHHSSSIPPSPRAANNEVLEEFKQKADKLSQQVDLLYSQLSAQSALREANELLTGENEGLKKHVQEMERTMSEVLSANDRNGSQELEMMQLMEEVANKDTELEEAKRKLAVATEAENELRSSVRESHQAAETTKGELDSFKDIVNTQNEQISELKSRLSDIDKAMSQSSSEGIDRRLPVVLRDLTKENESLKSDIRNMEKSTEQLLLSAKFHSNVDNIDRENKRLKQQVQELELILQSMSGNGGNSNASRNAVESLTSENDRLKTQLQNEHRQFENFRSTSETKLVELQQKVDTLTHENARLKIDIQSASRRPAHEDNSVPPPSYDDSFVVP